MRLYELCYGNFLLRYGEREWYDCCSSMDKVSRGRSYRQLDCCSSMDMYLGAGLIYIFIYVYILDCCSSMDNLGAGLLSTWIREIFLEIS